MGLVGGFGVSGWPSPQALASSWDPELTALNYGAMAQEFSAKGYSMLLAPVSGALGRSVLGGRNHETFVSTDILDPDTSRRARWLSLIATGLGSLSEWENVSSLICPIARYMLIPL